MLVGRALGLSTIARYARGFAARFVSWREEKGPREEKKGPALFTRTAPPPYSPSSRPTQSSPTGSSHLRIRPPPAIQEVRTRTSRSFPSPVIPFVYGLVHRINGDFKVEAKDVT